MRNFVLCDVVISFIMEDKVLAYFSGINPLAKKILEDSRKVEEEYGLQWNDLDLSKKENILDDFFIHSFVKDRYWDKSCNGDQVYPESFPKLSLSYGEKIIVDFDNDCWTWQDEHSGPFSWKTKSQQDLSIADLEPSELTKVKSSSKTDTSHLGIPKNGAQKIRDGPGKPGMSKRIWDSPFHVVERKGDSGYPSSQDSIQSSFDDVRQSLELNSREESLFSMQTNGGDTERTPIAKPAVLQISQKTSTNSSRGLKSPLKSPIISRLPLSPSFNKKNKNDTDDTADVLLDKHKRESVGQDNAAFVNLTDGESCEELPLSRSGLGAERALRMTGEWSSFVGESSSDTLSSGISSPSRRPLIPSREASEEPITEFEGTENQAAEELTTDHLLKGDEAESDSVMKSGFDFLDNW